MRVSSALFALIWLVAGSGPSTAGQDAAWQQRPHVALKLTAASLERAGRREAWAAVELKLDPGWKIYWRSPGGGGTPTTIDWSGSENLRVADTHWPRPQRARIWNTDTIGYGGEVALPAALTLLDPARATVLRVKIAYGVCREICIPDQAVLALRVEPGDWEAPERAERIRAALAEVPDRGNAPALRVRHAVLEDGRLDIEMESAAPAVAPDLFVEGPPAIRFGTSVAMLGNDRHRVRFEVPVAGPTEGRLDLVLTYVDGRHAFERRVTLSLP